MAQCAGAVACPRRDNDVPGSTDRDRGYWGLQLERRIARVDAHSTGLDVP
jgi:hypothetical protein